MTNDRSEMDGMKSAVEHIGAWTGASVT